MSDDAPRRLLVSGRPVARYWGVHPALVTQAEKAGLITKHVVTKDVSEQSSIDAPPIVEQGYDAARVLELGARLPVDPAQMVAFDPESILLVQQTSIRWHNPSDYDWHWRAAYGWHINMSPEDAVDSARGWWAVDPRRRPGVQAIVSAVSSFVVTLAVVDQNTEPAVHPDGRVRFAATAADTSTPLGRALLRVFHGRRVPVRQGVSRLLPRTEGPPLG